MAQTDPVVFKILTGVQAGVEVTLADGDYAVGSGPADDIQLIDVSLLPGHARLRLVGTAMEIAAGEGTLRLSSGATLDPRSAFQVLEPLDVVTAGTTRFALGPRSANWASVGEEDGGSAAPRVEAAPVRADVRDRLKVLAVPLIALVVLLGIGGWLVFGAGLRSTFRGHDGSADVATVRAALDAFAFGRPIAVRREVDGTVYIEGYVDTPVERRALAGALEGTGVPAHVRLWVLQSMREDIKELIAAEKVDVGFDLSPNGRLALTGVVIDKARAEALVSLLRDRVFGIATIDSGIRTGETILAEVRKLVAASGLQPWLILRLDKDLIEVDGALPSDKVDAWVGFLQSYADKFSKLIALRSFVQLQGENGKLVPAPTSALVLGGTKVAAGDSALSVAKLQSGTYDLSDVLAGVDPLAEKRSPNAQSKRQTGSASDDAPGPRVAGSPVNGGAAPQPGSVSQAAGPAPQAGAGGPGSRATADAGGLPPSDAAPGSAKALSDRAATLLRRFKDGTLSTDPSAADLYHSLVLLGGDDGSTARGAPGLPDWYLPLLAGTRPSAGDKPCWVGSQLDGAGLLPSLFWLDLLSASHSLSLASLPRDQQILLLEAALNPGGVAACARRSPDASRAADHSLYLREIRRNPGFLRFIARDLPPFSLDVAGANLGTERFILTPAGDRMFEGAAPDRGSRLASIGELGVVVQSAAGLSAVVFGPNIDWLVSN